MTGGRIGTAPPSTFCDKKVANTAIFGIPFSLELALALSDLFKCQKCGRCCRKVPKVYVDDSDVERIADYLGSTPDNVRGMMHIKGEHMIMPCPFLVDKICSIYPVKPIACKIYPMFRFVDDVFYTEPRLAMSLRCQASIELHNLLSMEKL